MSLFTRPSVVCAIIFGCFAVLIPRVFLPFLRPRTSSHHADDHFRRPPPMSRDNRHDVIEPISSSSPQTHSAHPNIPMHHLGVNSREQSLTGANTVKPAVTFALPMYTVGIAVFFVYTCFKYCKKRNSQEQKLKLRYSTDNIHWNTQKRRFKYQAKNRPSDDDEHDEDSYAGLDADYVEYLKAKKQKEFVAEETITAEQRQMHHTLDEMKNSLSFISSKLGATKTSNNLTNNEISQLQDRLASTEAQMYKIISALDAASTKMNQITKNTRDSLEQPHQAYNRDEEYHLSSRSPSTSEGSLNDQELSNSDGDSDHEEEQALFDNKHEQEEESSSSYEEDDDGPNELEADDDEESECESDRYGIMNTNYGCDPTAIDDYELDTNSKPKETSDSQTKVQEWHQRNHSQSLSSSNSSLNQDQSLPKEEHNRLTRRKHPE